MEIKKKINLDNNTYYISVEVEYEKHIEGFPTLRIKNYKNKYWDSGDCSLLIEKIEKAYKKEQANLYDKSISFMADILYIYDRIPFISKITEVSKTEETIITVASTSWFIIRANPLTFDTILGSSKYDVMSLRIRTFLSNISCSFN